MRNHDAGLQRGRSWRVDRPGRLLVGLALLALFGGAPLLACWEPDYYSVHFRNGPWSRGWPLRPDCFRMPQPWRGVPQEMRALSDADTRFDEPDRLAPAKKAIRLEVEGKFREAAAAWARYQRARNQVDPGDLEYWNEPPQVQGLEDRVAALQGWRTPGDTAALRLYLRARDLVNAEHDAEARFLLARVTREPYRTHAEYLRACIRFYTDTPQASAAAFLSFLRRHPRNPLAFYMIGRSFFSPVCTEKDSRKLGTGQRERYLRRAVAGYDACVAAVPNTSLANNARGMAGACFFRLGAYPEALFRYCDQLAALAPGADDHAAFLSARMCLRRMTLADHRAFQARAVTRPEIASVYLDLHLLYGQVGARSTYNLGLFALEVLKHQPAAPLSGRLLARLALIEGHLGRWDRTKRLAAAAMVRCAPGAYRDQARWQRAQALRQLHRPREALAEYERLAASATVPKMRRGAHEAAAVLSEEMGDRPNAIRHYFALEYHLDYAYLVDCQATQDELRAFLKRFPGHPEARLVRYSLGFRQLRAGQYDAAARTFASLGSWLHVAEKKYDCKTSKGKPRWPPLQTARFMGDAVRQEAAARTDGEKARAAYSRAQLLFRQRHLILYNGALWTGRRTWALDLCEPDDVLRQPGMPEPLGRPAYDRYQEEHAALYQALRIFKRIADNYPKTPEAPRALYSAALCYTFLPSLERYWTDRNRDEDCEGKAIHLYRRLQREYPHDPLATAAAQYGGPLPPAAERHGTATRRGSR